MNNKPKYNPHIHHRRSIRLKGYDYSQAGLYFITICCQDRACLFGEIVGTNNYLPNIVTPENKPQMILNDAGKIANDCWMEIPNHYPNAKLHEYIVMPNHIHGIIELVNDVNTGVQNFVPLQNKTERNVGIENFQPLQPTQNEFQKIIPRSIGSIVRGFKIGVTKWFRQNTDVAIVWQRNYYEHIIRDEQSYQNISNYIINNPAKWAEDKFYTK
ncbi:transposase [Flavobacterium filum]|uniref:transposase n=1 Tax=Flavobacterium filum TaxID=370974 RepID=UPI0023F3DE54|nr:transposase [Flavobacterium filum]